MVSMDVSKQDTAPPMLKASDSFTSFKRRTYPAYFPHGRSGEEKLTIVST